MSDAAPNYNLLWIMRCCLVTLTFFVLFLSPRLAQLYYSPVNELAMRQLIQDKLRPSFGRCGIDNIGIAPVPGGSYRAQGATININNLAFDCSDLSVPMGGLSGIDVAPGADEVVFCGWTERELAALAKNVEAGKLREKYGK